MRRLLWPLRTEFLIYPQPTPFFNTLHPLLRFYIFVEKVVSLDYKVVSLLKDNSFSVPFNKTHTISFVRVDLCIISKSFFSCLLNQIFHRRIKPENFRRWTIHIRHLSDVPVSRNWYKTVQNYTKTYMYQILYKSCSIKQIVFKKYATNLNMTISHRSLRISDLLLLSFLNFYFSLLIDIIDNIPTYSL